VADLAHETLPRWKGVPDNEGGPELVSGDGPEIADAAQLIQMITLGRTIAVLPRSIAGPFPRGWCASR
jgi:hypothetical protein